MFLSHCALIQKTAQSAFHTKQPKFLRGPIWPPAQEQVSAILLSILLHSNLNPLLSTMEGGEFTTMPYHFPNYKGCSVFTWQSMAEGGQYCHKNTRMASRPTISVLISLSDFHSTAHLMIVVDVLPPASLPTTLDITTSTSSLDMIKVHWQNFFWQCRAGKKHPHHFLISVKISDEGTYCRWLVPNPPVGLNFIWKCILCFFQQMLPQCLQRQTISSFYKQ